MLLIYGLLGFAAAFAIFCVVMWVVYVPVGARILIDTPHLFTDKQAPVDDGEDCEILSDAGVTLRGTYLSALTPESLGVIVFCHELNGDRWSALPYLDHLRESGFDVFTFDFRNHGESDHVEGYRPLPWLTTEELSDARSVVNFLAARSPAGFGIGVMGLSKGGATAMCAAAGDPRVRAIVTDGAYCVVGMQVHFTRRWFKIFFDHLPFFDYMPDLGIRVGSFWVRQYVKWRSGCHFVHVEQMVGRLKQPVLMIHGEKDKLVPRQVALGLRNRLAGRSKFWMAPSADHNDAITVAQGEYHRRLSRFFGRHIPAPRPAPSRWSLLGR